MYLSVKDGGVGRHKTSRQLRDAEPFEYGFGWHNPSLNWKREIMILLILMKLLLSLDLLSLLFYIFVSGLISRNEKGVIAG